MILIVLTFRITQIKIIGHKLINSKQIFQLLVIRYKSRKIKISINMALIYGSMNIKLNKYNKMSKRV